MADGEDVAARVAAVIVTHNSGHVVERCLASLGGVEKVIVVDNASEDDTRLRVAAARPSAVFIANDANVGFGAANNQGFSEAGDVAFVIFINPDAALQRGALDALIAASVRYPETALVAPRLIDLGGVTETSYDAGLFERAGMPGHAGLVPGGDLCAGFLSGAVFMARTAALSGAPPFDPNIFLFFEDDDLCMRLRAAGHSLVLAADAAAEHTPGRGSAPSRSVTWRRNWHMAWSRLYIEGKYRGRGAAVATGIANLARFAVKCVGYALILNGVKASRDAARAAGTLAWLLGIRARQPLT